MLRVRKVVVNRTEGEDRDRSLTSVFNASHTPGLSTWANCCSRTTTGFLSKCDAVYTNGGNHGGTLALLSFVDLTKGFLAGKEPLLFTGFRLYRLRWPAFINLPENLFRLCERN